MNPDTNRFEKLTDATNPDERRHEAPRPNRAARRAQAAIERQLAKATGQLLRPNGEPVPKHWTQFTAGENVDIKGCTFKVAYIGETSILFEPVGPIIVGETTP